MKTNTHAGTRSLTLAATALAGGLFAGSAAAMLGPEEHREIDTRPSAEDQSGIAVVGGQVGEISLTGKQVTTGDGEVVGRIVSGPVGRLFDAEQAD